MKKLLILGGSIYETYIVRRAQERGFFTVVTDMYDPEVSPAKKIADEFWNISWSDIDSLKLKCQECNIDGVIAGFSEFRVENLIKLTKQLELPCYCTMEHLDFTRDKELFKKTCKKYNIPVVPDYSSMQEVQEKDFPVIVKPVDRGGSIGISVAFTMDELKESVAYGLSLSPSKRIVIEKYMSDYKKIDVYYLLINGEYYFIGSSDTIKCTSTMDCGILQKAWIYPSVHESLWLKDVDKYIRIMMEGEKMQQGYITISAFTNGSQFYVFETGYRFSGELSFFQSEFKYGINYVDSMIDYAMGIPLNYEYPSRDKNMYSIVFNYFGKDGSINEIKGLSTICNTPSVSALVDFKKKGDIIEKTSPLNPYVAMIIMIDSDIDKLLENSTIVNREFDVVGKGGESLIIEKMTDEDVANVLLML